MRFGVLAFAVIGGGACGFDGVSPSGDGGNRPDAPIVDAAIADAAKSWFDDNYRARRRMTVDNAGRGELVGFPVAVRFDGSDAERMGTFGEKIRFRDATDSNDLPFEVEQFDSSALVWVRVDLPEDDITHFWMYYDIAQPAVTPGMSDAAATFAGFDAVYHFYDTYDVNGGPDPVNAAVGPNLTPTGSIANGTHSAAGVGSAIRFGAGETEHLTSGALVPTLIADSGQKSYEAWFRTTVNTTERFVFDAFDNNCHGPSLFIADNSPVGFDGRLAGSFWTSPVCGQNEPRFVVTDARVDDDVWHYAAFIVDRDGGQLRMFFDGAELIGDAISASSGPTQSELRIGNSTAAAAQSFDGLVDEVRIGPVRSADWYQVTYESTNPAAQTAFVTVFPEECFREQRGGCAPK